MKTNKTEVAKIETISENEVRLHLADGSTLRMAKAAYENGSWKKGTSMGFTKAIYGKH